MSSSTTASPSPSYVPKVSELKEASAKLRDGRYDPRCSVTRKENLAITLSYFSVGIVMSFIQTPLNVYLVRNLDAEPSVQNTITILQTLPWSLKLVFGFISDTFPICGMQRKPYLTMGALSFSFSFMGYAMLGFDSLPLLAVSIFVGTLGLIQMDVMADTMCVQRSKFEAEDQRGQMQATFYSTRFAGGLVGAILGACVCNQDSWGWGLTYHQVSFIIGLVPFLIVVPWLPSLKERFRISPKVLLMLSRRNSEALSRRNSEALSRRNSEIPAGAGTGRSRAGSGTGSGTGSSSSSSSSSSSPGKSRRNMSTMVDEHMDALELGAPTERTPLVLQQQQQQQPKAVPVAVSSGSGTGIGAGADGVNAASLEIGADGTLIDMEDVEPLHDDPILMQLNEIWQTVQLKSVWMPMTFVYTYNLLQIPNVAWQSYLQLTLHFPAWILGLTVILGSFMTFAGIVAYKSFFFRTSWRMIYVGTMLLTTFFSFMQLVLIFQWNTKYLHLNNYFFSLGDDVITAYIAGIQFLPVCIMYMRLCPDGAEGASYSMLTTFGNIALVCASNLGNLLANVWDVSNTALREGNVDGLWKLSLLTSALALLPLLWLKLLPKDAEDQEALAKDQTRSKLAGAVFLIVLIGSLLWTSVSAILQVAGQHG